MGIAHSSPVVIQVLHETGLMRLAHEVVLGGRAGAVAVLRVEEPGAGGVRVSAEVVVIILAILSTASDKAIILRPDGTVSVVVFDTAHRATTVGKPAPVVGLVRFVQGIGVAVSGGLATATYSG